MIGLRPQEMLLLAPIMLLFWLLPIVAGIWALVTLDRIRKAQVRLQMSMDALSKKLGSNTP